MDNARPSARAVCMRRKGTHRWVPLRGMNQRHRPHTVVTASPLRPASRASADARLFTAVAALSQHNSALPARCIATRAICGGHTPRECTRPTSWLRQGQPTHRRVQPRGHMGSPLSHGNVHREHDGRPVSRNACCPQHMVRRWRRREHTCSIQD